MSWKGCFASFHQLLLLLWRNTVIRWRSGSGTLNLRYPIKAPISIRIPFFQFLEVLWPIILYIILVILRNKFPPEQLQDSKYRAYAMPSAGAVPFLQTLFCDLGRPEDYGPFSDMPTFPNATVNGLYSILDEVGTWNASWTEVCESIHSLAGQSACLSDDGFNIDDVFNIGPGCIGSDPVPLSCYLKNSAEFRDYLSSNLSLSEEVIDGILGATTSGLEPPTLGSGRGKRQTDPEGADAESQSVDLFSLLQEFGSSPGLGKSLACSSDEVYQVIQFSNISADEVQKELCNLTDSQWLGLSQELQQQLNTECSPAQLTQSISQVLGLQNLLEQSDLVELLQGFSQAEWSTPEQENSTAENQDSCGNIDQYVPYFCGTLREGASDILESIINYSCSGDSYQQAEHRRENQTSSNQSSLKILYTPNTNFTRDVIKRANRTFETAGDIIALADEVANCSQFFLDNFDNKSLANVSKSLDELITYRESGVGALLLPDVSLDTLIGARDLLNSSQPNNIWSIMTTVHDTSAGIRDALMQFDWDIFLPLESEEEMESLAGDYPKQEDLGINYVLAGVVIEPGMVNSSLRSTTIRIRTNFSNVVDPSQYRLDVWRPGPENDFSWKARYLYGFVFVQDMLERAVMEQIVGARVASPGVYIQEMPYPCYKLDKFTYSMLFVLPLAMLFAWLFPVAMTARAVVREKETRLKEYMKMMGVGEGLLRVSWFVHSLAVLLFSVVGITLLLKLGGILPATDGFILFLFLTLYAVVMLSYSFLVSVFFNNANLAACVAALVYFLVFFAHVSIVPNLYSFSPFVLGLCCLWAPLAFGLGATFMVQWELKQQGVVWHDVATPAIVDDHISILTIACIMAFDAVLYTLIAWYIEGVFPGRFGVSKPFYFPFMPSYWCGQRCSGSSCSRHGRTRSEHSDEEELIPLSKLSSGEEGGHEDGNEDGNERGVEGGRDNCEEDPDGLPLGISIQKLSKHFFAGVLAGKRKRTVAVNDLSLNFYEGQITAFLGHNGAGKTTTMSVLTGLFEPSSGTAHIYGNNIRREMDMIRQSLGICPQHNILIDELTVEEHLWFYGQLKGLSRAEVKQEVPIWLMKVNLDKHAQKFSKNLSGGMKRKLSILLSFIGNSKAIILDEPTSGVDPYSRQQIWDFLLRHREGRTIMLSTHHMEEAEILGDRIAIISKGSLLCCGTFDYLKHRFGEGHRLTLVTKVHSDRRQSVSSRTFTVTAEVEELDSPDGPAANASMTEHPVVDACSEAELTEFIQQEVAGATIIEKRGREVHYRLPLLHARPRILASLFSKLELQKGRLGIMSYGLSCCTMEEVFIKLTEQELAETNEASVSTSRPSLQTGNSQSSLDTSASDCSAFDEEGILFGDTTCDDPLGSGVLDVNCRLSAGKLWLVQFYALLVKRVHYTKGKLVALTVQNVFPLLVICLSLFIARSLQTVPDPPQLELSPYLFFAKSHINYLFAGGYYTNETAPMVDHLFQPCGVAAHMIASSANETPKCYPKAVAQCPEENYPQEQFSCGCKSCVSTLFQNGSTAPPCYNGTASGSRILNLTQAYDPSFPNEAFYTMHNYLLRSSASFIEQRYGGVSFGHLKQDVDADVDRLNADSDSTLPFLASHSVAKAWYSLKGYHAMPAYLNTLNNAILRGSLNQTEYGIRTVSHPFKLTDLEKSIYAITENISFLVNPLAAIFSLGFVVAGFVLLLIEERSGNIKHLQLVCGMNKVVYWLSTFVWDLVWYTIFVGMMLILFLAFEDPYYTGAEELPLFLLLLLCYGLAAIPWMYMLSFIFTSSATAYVLLFCLNFFSGFCFLIVDAILVQLEERTDDNLLHYYLLGLPFPSYALSRSMMYLNLDRPLIKSVASFSSTPGLVPDPYSQLSPFMGSLIVQCFVYSSIIFVVEVIPVIASKLYCHKDLPLPIPCDEDEAVAKERRRVMTARSEEDLLVLRNLTKIYGNQWSSQYRLAVNQLCLRMKKAECFGLLGVNGAGKTSTFRMLTGDTFVSSGEAIIGSHHIARGARVIHHSVGYCPQVDALIDSLTGRQHLTFYCRLRGLPATNAAKVVEWALLKLGLNEHADKQVKAYSGGNRRKLSTAIALLARPALILLDEPTSGVDPRARQFLWTIVRGLISAGQSVLLTTHSMAECEALCSRVGIMVNGSFRCLGSPQQLKSTYGQGYRLKIRTGGQVEPVKEFIRQNMSSAILKEEHYNTLLYQLPSVGLQLPLVYETMEASRETLDIEDYSLSQTTLNDIFIHFANEQSEDVGLQVRGNRSHDTSIPPSPQPTHLKLPDIVTDIPL